MIIFLSSWKKQTVIEFSFKKIHGDFAIVNCHRKNGPISNNLLPSKLEKQNVIALKKIFRQKDIWFQDCSEFQSCSESPKVYATQLSNTLRALPARSSVQFVGAGCAGCPSASLYTLYASSCTYARVTHLSQSELCTPSESNVTRSRSQAVTQSRTVTGSRCHQRDQRDPEKKKKSRN